jgi:hypothetical protein
MHAGAALPLQFAQIWAAALECIGDKPFSPTAPATESWEAASSAAHKMLLRTVDALLLLDAIAEYHALHSDKQA